VQISPRIKGFPYYNLVLLAIALVAPFILRGSYQRELLVLCAIFGMVALSLDIIVGQAGQISFGHQAFFGIGAYASALVTLRLALPVWFGFLVAVAVAGIAGLFIGYICLRRLRAMTLAIVTFGLGIMLELIARNWHHLTGGSSGLTSLPAPRLLGIEFNSEISYYYLALVLLLVAMYFLARLSPSRTGRAITSLCRNESLASSVGVPPLKYYTLAFTIACALAGLSGALYAHHLTVVNPALFSLRYLIIMYIMVLIGGTRTLGGSVLGAVIYVCVSELLRFNEQLSLALLGLFLLTVIIFAPHGVYPPLKRLVGRFTTLWGNIS
jgi:branched-chain amino acid transport system permease protein